MQRENYTPQNNASKTEMTAKRRQEPKSASASEPFWKVIRIRAPAIVIPFPGLWPDGMIRWAEPATIRRIEYEVLSVLETLIALNRTGLYTAFFQYHAHVGTLSVDIYEGRWNGSKEPILKIEIDCRRYPLTDIETQKPFYARKFLEELILLVQ